MVIHSFELLPTSCWKRCEYSRLQSARQTQLLDQVSRPFFSTLHKWLFSGELYDPFAEFFVAVDSELGHVAPGHPSSGVIDHLSGDSGLDRFYTEGEEYSGTGGDGLKLWETKYRFRQEMLPLFVGDAFGKKVKVTQAYVVSFLIVQQQIFSTGKSLNFIRYSCHDSDWVITREKMSNSKGRKLNLPVNVVALLTLRQSCSTTILQDSRDLSTLLTRSRVKGCLRSSLTSSSYWIISTRSGII